MNVNGGVRVVSNRHGQGQNGISIQNLLLRNVRCKRGLVEEGKKYLTGDFSFQRAAEQRDGGAVLHEIIQLKKLVVEY